MAINQNTSWPNRNTLYLARSGGGKSQALAQNPEIPKSGARVLLWDLSHDHRGVHIDNRAAYVRAVKKGLESGKGFRLAYSGPGGVDSFEWWCRVVWAALDGDHLTYVIVEELSAVCQSVAKATPAAAVLLNQMRKFGGVFHGTSQKPQEISKTFYDQCEVLHIGKQRGDLVRKFSRELGIAEAEIENLKELEFWRVDPKKNGGNPEKYRLTYKKIN